MRHSALLAAAAAVAWATAATARAAGSCEAPPAGQAVGAVREQSLLQFARSVAKQQPASEESPGPTQAGGVAAARATSKLSANATAFAVSHAEAHALANAAANATANATVNATANATANTAASASTKSNESANASADPDLYSEVPYSDFGELLSDDADLVVPDDSGLLVELHMPGASLEDIRDGSHGSLAEFMEKLHGALCDSANVTKQALRIVDIHARYRRNGSNPPTPSDKEVLVRLQLVSAEPSVEGSHGAEVEAPTPRRTFHRLRKDLEVQFSDLRQSDVGDALQHSYLTLVTMPPTVLGPGGHADKPGGLSALALPMCISASFTAVLVWLAAW